MKQKKTYDDYLGELTTRLHKIHKMARDNLIVSKQRSKKLYDRRINPQTFNLGKYAYLEYGQKKGKFGDHYSGPHGIIGVMKDGNIKLRVGRGNRTVHPNRLRYSHINPKDTSDSEKKKKKKRRKEKGIPSLLLPFFPRLSPLSRSLPPLLSV